LAYPSQRTGRSNVGNFKHEIELNRWCSAVTGARVPDVMLLHELVQFGAVVVIDLRQLRQASGSTEVNQQPYLCENLFVLLYHGVF
jgi:hypothetical protein